MVRRPAPLIPNRFRKRFPPWPDAQLPEDVRRAGLEGVAHAREELARHRRWTADDDLATTGEPDEEPALL